MCRRMRSSVDSSAMHTNVKTSAWRLHRGRSGSRCCRGRLMFGRASIIFCGPMATGGCSPLSMGEGTLPPQPNAHFGSSRRRGGSVADPPGCLLGTLEAHLGARDPLEGGGPLRGGKTAAVTKIDVKARETQVAVVPPRPSPPPPCQLLTRASSWTACAWQGRHKVICGLGLGLGLGRGRLGRAGLGATELLGRVRACGRRGVLFRRTFRLLLFGFGVRELVIRDGVRTSNRQRRRRRFGDHPGNISSLPLSPS